MATNETIQAYRDGTMSRSQALHLLCNELGEVESEITPLQAQKDELRAVISEIIDRDGNQTIKGFGRITMTAPSKTTKYDTKTLDEFVMELIDLGETEIAQRISRTRKESARAGSLRIEREK